MRALRQRPGHSRVPEHRPARVSWLNVVAATLIAAGITMAFAGHDTLRWSPPPVPPAWAAAAGPAGRPPVPAGDTGRGPHPLGRSLPVGIAIPAIGVRADVIPLGLNRDGAVAVPPLTRPFVTSWYDGGPTPGEPGAAAIFGHVDAAGVGPAIFYRLGDLRPGDQILVRLHNGRTVIFGVYSVALYLKAEFPTSRVYGFTDWPTLRLVTCGGEFDPRTGHYLGDVVVFASYIGHRGR